MMRARLIAATSTTLLFTAAACGSTAAGTATPTPAPSTVAHTPTPPPPTPTPTATATATPTSTPVAGMSGALFAGLEHTCATQTNDELFCWGRNGDGELGNGTEQGSSLPVHVLGLSSALTLGSGGEHHSCALTMGGAVYCWGGDGNGQLGDGDDENRDAPVPVVGMSAGVLAIGAGWDHTCAVDYAGKVWCWGQGDDGRLGDGSTSDSHLAVQVMGMGTAATLVAAGGGHSCALKAGGAVSCWGANCNGQLGNGNNDDQHSAVETAVPLWATDLATGDAHTCVVTSAGGVLCWGSNDHGQLGDGTEHDRNVPTPVMGLSSGMTMVRAGEEFSCALDNAGGVQCWGANCDGELGDGTHQDSAVPVPVSGLSSGVSRITLGGHHACAEMANGSVRCWGANGDGQLGDGSGNDRSVPVNVSAP